MSLCTYYSPKGFAFRLQNTTTKENETLMAIGTAYVQGEDVAARGRVLLFSFTKSENSQNLVVPGSTVNLVKMFPTYNPITAVLILTRGH
jgi:hypothetical protein